MNKLTSTPELRLLPRSLGGFFRIAHWDRKRAIELLAEGVRFGSGAFIGAPDVREASELLASLEAAHLEAILDPMSVELSVEDGWLRRGVAELPWAGSAVQTQETFTDRFVRSYCRKLATTAVEANVTGVLAPTHFLESLPSQWLAVDERLAVELRHALNDQGGRHIAIYYPLVLSLQTIGRGPAMMYLVDFLARIRQYDAVDALTLRIHGFGVSDASPDKIQRYIDFARSLHDLDLPILGEKTGTLGLALMAFGAIGAIESGLTIGENCDLRKKLRPDGKGGRTPPPRVYMHSLGAFLSKKKAEQFLSQGPLKNYHLCQARCCGSPEEMWLDPRRHFVTPRVGEVQELSATPADMRPDWILRRYARASDLMRKAAKAEPSLGTHATRLIRWERALTEQRAGDKYQRGLRSADAPRGRRPLPPSRPSSGVPGLSPNVIDIRHRLGQKE